MIVTMIIGNIAKLGKHFETFFDLLAAIDKLGHLFDLPTEPADGRYTLPLPQGLRVELSHVSLHYSSSGSHVGPVSAVIDSGEQVAVVGPAGSGKSTLADILFGLRLPSEGFVQFDGNDIRQLHLDSVRRDVALVRDIEVFDGTIAENVHLGRSEVLDADVQRALRGVGLNEEISRLPEGLATRLTRGTGFPLSESQLRRLMLARSLAARPRFLVIDGLLDGLSGEILDRLAPAIFETGGTMTLVVMTWRRELIDRCDRTLTLSDHEAYPMPVSKGGH